MKDQYDPVDWTPIIERAFFVRLRELLGSEAIQERPSDPAGERPADPAGEGPDSTAAERPVEDLVRDRLAELEVRWRPLVANPMDAANLRFTALAVAVYDVLAPVSGAAGAAAVAEDCLNAPLRADILAGTREVLDRAGDAFAALVAVSKERERSYFGPSFRFERPVDDHDSYVLDVRRCLFHEALVAAGREELQPVLCRFDLNWADAIEPARHDLRFVRPVTFASGSTCRMLFTRVERVPGPRAGGAGLRESAHG
ncbi:L-2-amino-thiazoline-4-carboxylic acid hydrolase [Actinoplanes sp. DH11]|uniref:L-2-amino-thiazoline-4-carboxylic acid hydrolase n=1 Tax=Actinoplanes sp. DH11 TaxID=2857011 RepID=UPI001E4843B6|nr:L-2-amino-thiazoline-4-carboxylic acid hydrolase [Actinoplanes sp. DH11]